ncbi:hypothetical protein HNP46_000453 [Pseudomonas nitritireducens]|uniref:Uncharacterized protein n=1 Tax=Pseudomonas nitroreducens TaxID=46680 RepID=A0A7W7KF15_PSENT|nr:hypothetical protein [Pseudomonas nitritireducens]MBB4861642.1 hypothetical protein [Pseudomonas nitritireducens]
MRSLIVSLLALAVSSSALGDSPKAFVTLKTGDIAKTLVVEQRADTQMVELLQLPVPQMICGQEQASKKAEPVPDGLALAVYAAQITDVGIVTGLAVSVIKAQTIPAKAGDVSCTYVAGQQQFNSKVDPHLLKWGVPEQIEMGGYKVQVVASKPAKP